MSITRVINLTCWINNLSNEKHLNFAIEMINKVMMAKNNASKTTILSKMILMMRSLDDEDLRSVINEAQFQLAFGRDFTIKHSK